ncbi:MAG: ATP-binding protein [Bacteroidota bacterium]
MIEISKKSTTHLHIDCSSEFEHLDRIVDETEAFLGGLITDPEFAYKIVLLVSEAATNAIEHGNALDVSKQVKLDVKVIPSKVTITVEDEGEGFERTAVQNPTADENLLIDGGRGLFFIEEMADDVSYELNGRRVNIVFNR